LESHNNILQENSRDYKRFDTNFDENSTEITQTDQATFDEIAQPEKLVSSTTSSNEEEDSTKLLLTTVISTKLNNYHRSVTTTTTIKSTTAIMPTTLRPFFQTRTSNLYKNNNNTSYAPSWRMRHQMDLQQSPSSPYPLTSSTDHHQHSSPIPTSMILMRDRWRIKSGCFYSCIQNSKGLQTVVSKYDFTTSIRLCEPTNIVRYLVNA
jgi:hypothetical protein